MRRKKILAIKSVLSVTSHLDNTGFEPLYWGLGGVYRYKIIQVAQVWKCV